jgi:single stranded DNA-binding protein
MIRFFESLALSGHYHSAVTQSARVGNGTAHTRFSLATNVSWKDKDSGEYKTRTEWHRIVVWGKFGEWAGSLKKGAFIEAEGELRYREFQPNGSDAKIRTAESGTRNCESETTDQISKAGQN